MNDQANDHSKEKDPRTVQIEERKKKMADLNRPAARVRVTPRDDDMRRLLKHPNGVGFPKSGSVEWPHDQFTRRRIKEGSVSLEESRHDEGRHERPRRSTPAPEPAA